MRPDQALRKLIDLLAKLQAAERGLFDLKGAPQ